MDGRKFDDLARSFADRTDRRRFLRHGVVAAMAGALVSSTNASAARRGKPPTTTICKPDGAGGYTRVTIETGLLPAHLATGSVVDNGCCSGLDCTSGTTCADASCDVFTGQCIAVPTADGTECTPDGPINLCRTPYTCQAGVCAEGIGTTCASVAGGCTQLIGCNPSTGQCEYGPRPDGSSCNRGTDCVRGTCSAGVCLDPPVKTCPGDACRSCGYDACSDSCSCIHFACGSRDPECESARCDPEIGCVFTPINEGQPCGTTGGMVCYEGVCTAFVQEE